MYRLTHSAPLASSHHGETGTDLFHTQEKKEEKAQPAHLLQPTHGLPDMSAPVLSSPHLGLTRQKQQGQQHRQRRQHRPHHHHPHTPAPTPTGPLIQRQRPGGSGILLADTHPWSFQRRFLETPIEYMVPSKETANRGDSVRVPDVSLPLFISVVSGTAVVVLIVVIYCTWRTWLSKREQASPLNTPEMARPQYVLSSQGMSISQSTPDLNDGHQAGREYIHEECKIGKQHFKTVIKQSTLPTVSQRHQRFQRQLSYKLDLSNVEFTIHSMKYHEQPRVGNLKPELYRQMALHDGSSQSSRESIKVVGTLHFSLSYIEASETLVVSVIRAENLPPKDFSGTSDPYAKIYLLPDRKRKCQTKVLRKTLNPEFNETFAFPVDRKSLCERTLQFSVYDFDRFSRHDLIGVVVVREVGFQLDAAEETSLTMDIINVQQEQVDLGELMLSLCYLPTAGRLTVTIIKARDLKAMDITGTSDPYVKVSLMCQGKRIKKRKTSVKRNTLSPVYNEAIVFDVPRENVEDVSLFIKVIDYDRVGSNELMGCFALGPQYLDLGRDHWFEMLESPRRPVAQWYPLHENLPALPQGGATKRAKP